MAPKTGQGLPPAEIEQELGRVLASSAFSRPRRLSRLLRHLVEHTLQGKEDCLKETLLGIEVFDRGRDFDPKADPIVRIDARRLRARLTQYYADEGATDPVLIVLEPGSYVPSFRRREEQDAKPEFLPLSSCTRHSVAVLPLPTSAISPNTNFSAKA